MEKDSYLSKQFKKDINFLLGFLTLLKRFSLN